MSSDVAEARHVVVSDHDTELLTITVDGIAVTFSPRDWWTYCAVGHLGKEYLDPYSVVTMRRLYHEQKISSLELAKRFGVSRRTVFRIVGGHTYRHLPMPEQRRSDP